MLNGYWIEMYSWAVEKSRYCWPEVNAVGWGWVTRLGIDWFAGCWSRVPQSVVTTTDAHLCFLLSLLPLAPTLSSAHSLLQQPTYVSWDLQFSSNNIHYCTVLLINSYLVFTNKWIWTELFNIQRGIA